MLLLTALYAVYYVHGQPVYPIYRLCELSWGDMGRLSFKKIKEVAHQTFAHPLLSYKVRPGITLGIWAGTTVTVALLICEAIRLIKAHNRSKSSN